MTDTVMTGDLCRDWYDRDVRVAEYDCACCTLIAKGPGWTRHDGSSVNPVPGASCEIYGGADPGRSSHIMTSERWTWPLVQFYRVTSPAVPAPVEAPELTRLRAENAALRAAGQAVVDACDPEVCEWDERVVLDAVDVLAFALKEGVGA